VADSAPSLIAVSDGVLFLAAAKPRLAIAVEGQVEFMVGLKGW
jgi:hypothetical protein